MNNFKSIKGCLFLLALLCVVTSATAQKKEVFFYDANFYGAVDGQLGGPCGGVSAGVQMTPEFSLLGSYYLFYSHGFRYNQNDITNSLDMSFSFRFIETKTSTRGVYLGGGAAYQFKFVEAWNPKFMKYFTGAYHLGYGFPVRIKEKSRFVGIEMKAYGPYNVGTLTQLMLGARLRF